MSAFPPRLSARIAVPLVLFGSLVFCAAVHAADNEAAASLPVGPAPDALAAAHFPDAMRAFVFRNWGSVPAARIAAVLSTGIGEVTEVASSMGLAAEEGAEPEFARRGAITVIRRNWHLLPYAQLLALLDMTAEELSFMLREDDFLFVKLGSLKPRCAPLRYSPPGAAARARAAEIRAVVARSFAAASELPSEPRFAFVEKLRAPPAAIDAGVPGVPARSGVRGLRFVHSYFGAFGDPLLDPELDPYPEGLLARLARRGINGVWLHALLRGLAPGGEEFPELGAGHERRLETLRLLVERARRHGISVYLYMNEPRSMPLAFFARHPQVEGVREGEHAALCTSTTAVRRWLADALAFVFARVPGLGGVFTITASENLTHCGSHFRSAECARCATRSEAELISEVNATIAEGVRRGNPDARVIAWDWGWNRHGHAPETISRLPRSVALLSVSEWSLPIARGGVSTTVGEYSLSAPGPGPRASRHWELARKAGLATLAKVQLNTSWELGSLPFLPVLDLVAEHCSRLARAGVDGLMLSWTVGGYPSPNLEIPARFAAAPGAEPAAILDALARDRYGERAAPGIRAAWRAFSDAFREYPLDIAVLYNGPQHLGPANLLHARPTGFHATMVGLPYDDLDRWRGPYPREVFAAQFERLAAGWKRGLAAFEAALALVSPELRARADADYGIARAAHLHFASVANQARFVMARDAQATAAEGSPAPIRARRAMQEILEAEIELALELFPLARRDARIGFEASNHYFYTPRDLIEKVVACEFLLARLDEESRAKAR